MATHVMIVKLLDQICHGCDAIKVDHGAGDDQLVCYHDLHGALIVVYPCDPHQRCMPHMRRPHHGLLSAPKNMSLAVCFVKCPLASMAIISCPMTM